MIKDFFQKKIIKELSFIFILYILIGYIMLFTPLFDKIYSITNIAILFFIFSIIYYIQSFYATNKKSLKLFSIFIANVLISSCLFLSNENDQHIILTLCIIIHTIFNISLNIIYLSKSKDKIYLSLNFIYNLMLLVLGIIVSINFYYKTTFDIITLGYYFISYGFISIFEIIIYQYSYMLDLSNKKRKKRKSLKDIKKTKVNKNK